MSRTIIICGGYPPNISGGAQLCKNIAEGLAHKGNDVYVLSLISNKNSKSKDGNVKIIRRRYSPKLYTKTLGFLAHRLHSERIVYYNNVANSLEQIHIVKENVETISPDIVITVCYPFFAHIIGKYLKEEFSNIKWIAYYIDPFFSNEQYHVKSSEFMRRKEMKVISTADRIVMLEWMSNDYRQYIDEKRLYLSYIPLSFSSIPNEKPDSLDCNKKLMLLYCGTLYKGIREPDYLFDLCRKIYERNSNKIKVFVIGKKIGYSSHEISQWKQDFKKEIAIMDPVAHTILEDYYQKASILLSIQS